MPYAKFILLLLLTTLSCSRKTNQFLNTDKEAGNPRIEISGINLSEDLSRLSSNNDELLILLYEAEENLSPPIFQKYFVFDEEVKNIVFNLDQKGFIDKDLLFILVEVDSELGENQIEGLIRSKHKKLQDSFENQDRIEIKSLIGDEDLMDIRTIQSKDLKANYAFKIQGIHKADRYEYLIGIYLY